MILLVSLYELGHQPLALSVAAGLLESAGFRTETLDLAVEELDREKVARARVAALSVPMHTALRLGVRAAAKIREINPTCHVCFFGLYAALNREYLLEHAADSVVGPED